MTVCHKTLLFGEKVLFAYNCFLLEKQADNTILWVCAIYFGSTVGTRYNEILGTEKFCLLYQISCYIRSLYIEFPLYSICISVKFIGTDEIAST